MAIKNKHFRKHSNKESHHCKSQKEIFCSIEYGFNADSLREPKTEHLYPAEVWQKGTRLLASFLLHVILTPGKREESIEISSDLLSGLPKALSVQAFKAAEDLMRIGKSSHFVSCPKNGTLRFDSCVEAQAYVYSNAGAKAAKGEQINDYLFAKVEELVFLV